jgi:RimJ/RimL family protein N-acetyltransferase
MITLAGAAVLETERLVLRAPGPQDWPVFRDFIASPRSVFVRGGDTLDDAKAWRAFCHIIGTWVARGYGSFVITARGEDRALGLTGPWHPIDWPERELGWTIWSGAVEGRGIAREAALAARDHAFRDLGWDTAVSYIDPANTRSIALAERLGAMPDHNAAWPGEKRLLVYRHPGPEAHA